MGQAIKLDIYEGGVGKESVLVFSIDSSDKTTLREIIVKKVSEEFNRFSEEKSDLLHLQNGSIASKTCLEEEAVNAIAAFEQGKYIVLVSDKQIQKLDEQISVVPNFKIEFFELLPLEGAEFCK